MGATVHCRMLLVFGAATTVLATGAGCRTTQDQVNQLAVLVHGTGRAGLAVTVNTYHVDRRGGVRAVTEDGSLSFRLHAADEKREPDPARLMGQWDLDEAATKRLWSPKSWTGSSTYSVLLPWQGEIPPPRMALVLVTRFTPKDRATLTPHAAIFEMSLTAGPVPP